MNVKSVMTAKVKVIGPEETLRSVARLMRDLGVGMLPICAHDRLIGTVTDRDIVLRAVAEGRALETTTAKEIMTSPVRFCFEDEDIHVASRTMQERQIRRMIVLNRDMRMVGIVSLGDLALRSEDTLLCGKTLEAISEPANRVAA